MPASVAQERIWEQSCHGSESSWNVAVRFKLQGSLSVVALEAALRSVASQNEILRTYFTTGNGRLTQVIYPFEHMRIALVDLSAVPQNEREEQLQIASKREALETFDLGIPPLWRVRLIRLDVEEHVFLLTMHHIISDGWSIGLFSDALMKAYGGVSPDAADDGSGNGLQFADYSVWLEHRRTSNEYQEHAEFWKSYIVDGDTVQASALQPNRVGKTSQIHSIILPIALTDDIQRMALHNRATFYHVALSAFVILRAMVQNDERVAIGTPVSGRDSLEVESIIGPFVNYIPFTITCSANMSVESLVWSTTNTWAELIGHAEYRYEDMLKDAGTQHDLFASVFICQRDFVHTARQDGLELSAMPSVSSGSWYDLTFFLVERADGWRLSCEVNEAKYKTDQALDLIRTYMAILIEMVRDPSGTIGELFTQLRPAVTIEDLSRAAAREYVSDPVARSLDLGSLSIVRFPASEAQVQYWLLDQSRADKTTFHLRIRLMVEGKLDPVFVREALTFLVRRHSILRTTFVMKDGVLSQLVHDPTFPLNCEYRARTDIPEADQECAIERFVEEENYWLCDLENGPLFRTLHVDLGNDRSLLLITLSHLIADGWSCGALQREFEQAYRAFSHHHSPNMTEFAMQYGNAAQVEQLWLRGAEARRRAAFWKDRLSGRLQVLDLPADLHVNHMNFVNGELECLQIDPECDGFLRQLAKELGTTSFVVYGAFFQALLFRYCGETDITFTTPFANRMQETANAIGPYSTSVLLRSRVARDWTIRSYIESLRAVAMDAFDHALPLDRYAEAVALTSRGGRHALNQVCFFYQRAFVGTKQIEDLLFTPLRTTAAGASFEWQLSIIEREDGICAELQYDADRYSRGTIQLALRHYVNLISLCQISPKTPVAEFSFATQEEIESGAQSRDVLPISRRALGMTSVIPDEPPVEETGALDLLLESSEATKVIKIWEALFRRRGFGVDANFFELGGHSLMFARLQALIQKEFGVRITTGDIFSTPTIASLTKRLIQNNAPGFIPRNPRIIPICAEGDEPPLFLISQSMIFRRMAEHLGPNQPVFTIQMQDDDLARCGTNASFEAIAEFYANIVREACPRGPYRIGGWCVAGWLAYEVAQSLLARGGEVELLVIVDAWAPGYWRDMIGRRWAFAKVSYYWSRLKLHTRTMWALPLSDSLTTLDGRLQSWSKALVRLVNALLFSRISSSATAGDQSSLLDRAISIACRTYQPKPTQAKALLFRSAEQPSGPFLASDMGWTKLLGSTPKITALIGDHHQIFNDPGAVVLANEIASALSTITVKTDSMHTKMRTTGSGKNAVGKFCPDHSR